MAVGAVGDVETPLDVLWRTTTGDQVQAPRWHGPGVAPWLPPLPGSVLRPSGHDLTRIWRRG
jgi:hypothetical protein